MSLQQSMKPMPKVLRIINRLNLGGPTYNACYLTKHLAPEFETLLVAGMKDESEASSQFIAENMGIQPVYIKEMHREINFLNDYKAYKKIKKIIEEFKPDIVHTHAAKSGALGRLAAYNAGVPVILHTFHGHVFHSYFNPVKTKIFLAIERYLARKSTKIIAISKKQKDELTLDFKIAETEKFSTIPLGFDLQRFQENQIQHRKQFRNKYFIKDTDIAVGIVGRLVPVKNHFFFLEAFSGAKSKTTKNLKAIIIGDGELRQQIEEKCKKLRLSFSDTTAENVDVLFTSWIKNIETALPGLEIMALTSLNEGTPVSLIEAQASNLPIVSTKVGGIEDVVIENQSALLSSSDDVKAFTNNIIKLTEDQKLRKKMSHEGQELVFERFSYNRLVKDMRDLYNSLLLSN